jgi:hypothetical protein
MISHKGGTVGEGIEEFIGEKNKGEIGVACGVLNLIELCLIRATMLAWAGCFGGLTGALWRPTPRRRALQKEKVNWFSINRVIEK